MPNNRQWATIFWFAVLIVFLVARANTRRSIREVARLAVVPKVAIPVVVLATWVVGLAFAAKLVGLWGERRVTDTVFWFVTAGLVLFGQFVDVSRERRFVRRRFLATLRISIFVAVFFEVYVLNLLVEILLQPFFFVLGGMSVVAGLKPEHQQVKRLVDIVSALLAVGLLVFVTASIADDWGRLDTHDLVQQFALPIWLTAGVLPYIYLLGLLAAYEAAFVRMSWRADTGRWHRWRSRLVLATTFHVRAAALGDFNGAWQLRLGAATSVRAGRRIVSEFRDERATTVTLEKQKAAEVDRYADTDECDGSGRRLDRREFSETTTALRWLATCQMGWYRRSDVGRYRPDLLEFALAGDARGLPEPHSINLSVSDDGQSWYASRRTITGWVFAIGAATQPPDQWLYEGAEPPRGFPGSDPSWGEHAFGSDTSRNW